MSWFKVILSCLKSILKSVNSVWSGVEKEKMVWNFEKKMPVLKLIAVKNALRHERWTFKNKNQFTMFIIMLVGYLISCLIEDQYFVRDNSLTN